MKRRQKCRRCGKVFFCDGSCGIEGDNDCECAKCFLDVKTYKEAVEKAKKEKWDVCEIRCSLRYSNKEKVKFT